MATFKALIRPHQKKQDGTYNVKIRVTHKRVLRDVATNIFVNSEDITRSNKIKNQQYIDQLDEIVRQCRRRCNENASILGDMTVDDVVALVKDIITGEKKEMYGRFDLDFIQYGLQHIQKLKDSGRKGNAGIYETSLNNLIKFVGRESVSIHEITAKFIENWIDWIQTNTKGGRAQSLYPSIIRALHNRAKEEYNDEDLGIVRIPLSPFKKVKLPKMPERRERALSVEQVRKIFALEAESAHCHNGNNRFNFARDMFMLSFGLVGMNVADLFNCTDYKDGRITYKRKKVTNRRADGAKISIKVEPEIQPLVDKYKDPHGKRVFCFYKMYRDENTFSAAINGRRRMNKKGEVLLTGLKKIGDLVGENDLEFYAARHSWASIAQNDLDIDKYTVHVALNHVIDEMKVTDIYTKKDWRPIDRANRKVLDFVLGKS